MTKISVIIPVYNVETYLRKCLDSVVNQTLKEIEIIIINDGSTDNSLQIIEEYAAKDDRIKVINQANQGQSAARNRGIEIAQGEYIGFVDSDDWIDLDFYEKLYERAKAYDADIAAANSIQHVKNKIVPLVTYEKESYAVNLQKKIKLCYIPYSNSTCNKIFRRSKINEHDLRFKEGLTSEDMLFLLQVAFYLESLVTVPEVTYNYFIRDDSTERTVDQARIISGAKMVEATKQFAKEKGIKLSWIDMHSDKLITVYRFFGVPVFKIKKTDMCTKYYLFGITVMKKEEYIKL